LTPDDEALDLDFFRTGQPLTLYRIAKTKYANLSGVGAAQTPGRWNGGGWEAIYTSTERSMPVLEKLVHLPKDLIPSNQALMTIKVSGNWEGPVDYGFKHGRLVDGETGGTFLFFRTLIAARHFFAMGHFGSPIGTTAAGELPGLSLPFARLLTNPFAVAVPSVIVPVWNVVLYPQGSAFWDHVKLENIEPFEFDSRLFPEGTPPNPEPKPVQPSA
jgi:RES domain-containing protein